MSQFDELTYRPDLKRDEREVTGWQQPPEETTRFEDEDGRLDQGLPVSDIIDQYETFKEEFKERVEKHQRELSELELSGDEHLERALQETGHVSKFTGVDYQELFDEKESSPGAYLIQLLEKQIEGEDGDLGWEVYIEYLEMIEELEVLDYYIKEILYPIFNFQDASINSMEDLIKKEKDWLEEKDGIIVAYNSSKSDYKASLYTDANKIPRLRDELHQSEKEMNRFRQENSQIDSALTTVDIKMKLIQEHLGDIDQILGQEIHTNDLLSDITRLSSSENEKKEMVQSNLLMLKQTLDAQNALKNDLKETRRNIYSKNRQNRIINEYGTVNSLYRRNVLPTIHQMKGYQDQTTPLLDQVYDESAKSLLKNHEENIEKTYESYIIQISTSQIRRKRLNYVGSKEKIRTLFNDLLADYKEIEDYEVESG